VEGAHGTEKQENWSQKTYFSGKESPCKARRVNSLRHRTVFGLAKATTVREVSNQETQQRTILPPKQQKPPPPTPILGRSPLALD